MQLLLNGLIAGSLAALVAGGLALVYGVLGVFNLALGQIVLVGGYIAWWLYSVGCPLWFSILGGLATGGVVTWLTFCFFVEPFYKRHRFLPLVTTIALSMILDGLILIIFGESPKSIRFGSPTVWTIMDGRISVLQVGLIVVTIILLSILAYVLHSTAFGRRIRAVVEHPQAVESLGVPSRQLHTLLFVGSGILASCAGIFLAIDQNLTPVLAFSMTIKAYAAIIAGGKGNVWGAILCAYLIAILEQLVVGLHWFNTFYVPAGFQDTVALAVIILFLIVRPQGLFGLTSRSA